MGLACAWSQSASFFPEPEILGPSGGDVRALALDPKDPRILYAGTPDGAIYKSVDGAQSWSRLVPGIGRRGMVISRLVVEPGNSQTIYAAAWQLMSSGGGLFRSTDGGSSWEEVLFGTAETSIRSLAIAPSNTQVLYAGTLRGIYKSVDRGQNWRFLPESAYMVHGIESLVVDSQNPSVVLAGSRRMAYRSEDGGVRWTPVVKGMQEDSDIFDLLVIGNDGSRIFAAACTGVYLSEDGGTSWQQSRAGTKKMKERTRCLALDLQNRQLAYAGTTAGLYRSQDGGTSWELWSGQHLTINAVAVDPLNSQTVYLAAEDVGILKSIDGGKNFNKANQGLIVRNVAALVTDDKDSSHLVMGVLYDNAEGGIFRSRDGGKSWEASNDGVPVEDRNVFALYQHPSEPERYFAGTSSGLFVSRDGAATWFKVPADQISGQIMAIAGASFEGRSLLLAGGMAGLFSSENGTHWKPFPFGDPGQAVHSVAFPSGRPEQILIGCQGQVWVTENAGQSWRVSRVGLPSVTVQSMACPVGWDGPWFLGNRYGVFRSRNQGRSWEHVGADLGAADITALAFFSLPSLSAFTSPASGRPDLSFSETPRRLQVSSENGHGDGRTSEPWILAADTLSSSLLISPDGGESWQRALLPAAGSRIWTLWIERARGLRLFAGSASDGIYSIDLSKSFWSHATTLWIP